MSKPTHVPEVRKGQADWPMPKDEFVHRFKNRFFDPLFDAEASKIDELAEIAWRSYSESNKSPRTRAAGEGFADPTYQLSVEWIAARESVKAAQKEREDPRAATRVLLICAASRNDKTCPGEMSKTYRLVQLAKDVLHVEECDVDLLDLSHLTSEANKVIYPCKACVSTSMALCHWPCSCYPNHALGQVNDWMNDIYPRWVRADAVLIVTPVYWYQAPSGLKLMMDRLVCADGGNPDPTTTHGKDPVRAKQIELEGWDYPRHLAGRAFGVVVHGDAEGADTLRRSLVDWLADMHLIQAGQASILDRYVGYYEPYATSHEALDRDAGFQEEVRNVARSVAREAKMLRAGRREPDQFLKEPRPK
ncbi:MAG TPA: NAD(P)H-dependent oxidoreductase [Steroidobacteraceae bacterium]|nr:NAD(P)H-dependent oxidoreductase [Steroidobacteraceae bacterium]